MRLVTVLLASMFFSASAIAQEPSTALDQLRAAAETAMVQAATPYAFTVDAWSKENDEETNLKLRFDPRREEGEQWTVIGARAEDLDKKSRKALKALNKGDAGDSPLIYDGLTEFVGHAVLVEEKEDYAIFSSSINDEDTPQKVRDAIEVLIRLEKSAGYVSEISLRSKEPFKPAPIAKIKSMMQRQEYSAPVDGGPALLRFSESAAEGKAMMKSFVSETRRTFLDIEPVSANAAGGQPDSN